MGTGVTLVHAWEGSSRDDALAWRTPGAERVLIDTGRCARTLVNLRRPHCDGRSGALALPAPHAALPAAPRTADEHLAAGPGETSPAWLSCADVIVRGVERPALVPGVRARLRASFPGCLVLALSSHGGAYVATAVSGWSARLVADGREACTVEDVASYASAVHAWITSGRPLEALGWARLTVLRGRAVVRPGVWVTPEDRPASPAEWGGNRRAGS